MVKRWLMTGDLVVGGAMGRARIGAKHEMCRGSTPNVLRCHTGRARTFFIAGTNYTGILGKSPGPAGARVDHNRSPRFRGVTRFAIVFRMLRARQRWSGAHRVGWHMGCIPTGRPPVWRAVVRPARYFFIWQKVAWRRFLRDPKSFPQAKSVVFACYSAPRGSWRRFLRDPISFPHPARAGQKSGVFACCAAAAPPRRVTIELAAAGRRAAREADVTSSMRSNPSFIA